MPAAWGLCSPGTRLIQALLVTGQHRSCGVLQDFYALILNACQKILCLTLARNMDGCIQLKQRPEYKGAVGHARMRYFQIAALYPGLPVKQ